MRICKPNEAGLIFGQGGPSMTGGFGDMSYGALASSKPSAPAPSTPSITPSTPSTMNPTFSGQPSQTDPSQGLPAALCGPSVVGTTAALGSFGGFLGAFFGAAIGDAIKDNMCPKADANLGTTTTASAEAGGSGSGSLGNDAYGGMDTSNMC